MNNSFTPVTYVTGSMPNCELLILEEPSLRRRFDPIGLAQTNPEPQISGLRDLSGRTRTPPNRGLCNHLREFSTIGELRGGPERSGSVEPRQRVPAVELAQFRSDRRAAGGTRLRGRPPAGAGAEQGRLLQLGAARGGAAGETGCLNRFSLALSSAADTAATNSAGGAKGCWSTNSVSRS